MPAHVRTNLKSNMARTSERIHQLVGHHSVPRTVVLCYHSICKSRADLSIDPQVLRRQVIELKDAGYEFLNFGDLVHRIMKSGMPTNDVACITFDDGYEDNLTQAAPILSELGVPATFFITSGLMSGDAVVLEHFHSLTKYPTTYLSPRQVAEMSEAGFEIGAHTHSHPNMARLSAEKTRDEVTHSKNMLEDVIGKRVRTFAYPFGKRSIHYRPQTISVLRESGFDGAAAVAFRSVTSRSSIRMFEIPRFFVMRAESAESFRQKMAGHFDWLGMMQELTPLWLKTVVSPEDKY